MADNWSAGRWDIIKTIDALNYQDIKFEADESLIQLIDDESMRHLWRLDGGRINIPVLRIVKNSSSLYPSPWHICDDGSPGLTAAGFESLHLVQEQAQPDGNFPTVSSPNPKNQALQMGIDQANPMPISLSVQILIATDWALPCVTTQTLTLLNGNRHGDQNTFFT